MPFPKFFTFQQQGEYDARVRKGNEVSVTDALKELYGNKILPLEKHYNYEEFFSTPLEPAYFDSKPLVLLFGEYSTGKTSFIKYILGKEYPGMRIGPEPTTDNFIVVEYAEDEGIVPGNALVVDKSKQYGTLSKFGGQFLNRFQCSTVKCELLEKVTLVDTPGILSGEKERGYDLTAVLRWFAERCDRIILLFDINKLDISDELRAAIDMVRGYEDKIKIVLNKSDTVNTQQLMRVYGALMWSLGKVMATPEAARVYIGSFWENPWIHEENRHLFEEEEADLIVDIYTLARDADLRKLNDLVRRAKCVRIHAYIMAELRRHMPFFGFGVERRKKRLIHDLAETYERLSMEYCIPPSDFPNIKELRRKLNLYDFNRIKARKKKLFENIDQVLGEDIGRLVPLLPVQDKDDAAAKERERRLILNKVRALKGQRKKHSLTHYQPPDDEVKRKTVKRDPPPRGRGGKTTRPKSTSEKFTKKGADKGAGGEFGKAAGNESVVQNCTMGLAANVAADHENKHKSNLKPVKMVQPQKKGGAGNPAGKASCNTEQQGKTATSGVLDRGFDTKVAAQAAKSRATAKPSTVKGSGTKPVTKTLAKKNAPTRLAAGKVLKPPKDTKKPAPVPQKNVVDASTKGPMKGGDTETCVSS